MNYIKRLEEENKRQKEAIESLISGMREFRGFLFSEKFHNDPYILNKDVDAHLQAFENEIHEKLNGIN